METQNNKQNEKELIYYEQLVRAWIDTRFEFDRQLIWLSAGGLGFVLSLMASKKISGTLEELISIVAALFFLVSVVTMTLVFRMNAEYIRNLVREDESSGTGCWKLVLKVGDLLAVGSFFMGILFASLLSLIILVR